MLCKLCNPNDNFEVISKVEDFYLTFDNYGLHYGHLLLIPQKHVLNLTQDSSNLTDIVLFLADALKEYFHQDIVIYEHGNITENRTNNISIDHAHLHLLPIKNEFETIEAIMAKQASLEYADFQEFYSISKLLPYHFVSLNGTYSFCTFDSLMSQAFRKTYAVAEGVENWDWKLKGIDIIKANSAQKRSRQQLKEYLIRRLEYDGIK